jgi:hypothetical protein
MASFPGNFCTLLPHVAYRQQAVALPRHALLLKDPNCSSQFAVFFSRHGEGRSWKLRGNTY